MQENIKNNKLTLSCIMLGHFTTLCTKGLNEKESEITQGLS